MVKYTGKGLVAKRPGVLSKVQMLTLVLGVRVFSLLPTCSGVWCRGTATKTALLETTLLRTPDT